ncbi:MAG: type II 3-dehydroquinate dehydratase [Candidatus Omnitrophica bacterium]|nr:type II 3-dehydroquinate dehydratase [Candidatus Omnitrophota bacterium]MBU4302878.1 type II 3-dehydroquinate dehydratase [Candidatus Omnitrophota bacterium]MBU4418954.1 type II 3-dehydroquinate dehydratase [Candidatus Omnitrophota bacterium]MBU4468748.1 type II 3-dehydroquinate dehydratase [Candidatus Omnitrophota bacterium]MCG2708240.1 type II 3-dehydroquinate dehydratase [Candidatus Omnitrophota bacterium]
MKKILVIHGPNLNLLGTREPGIYGRLTLAKINQMLKNDAKRNKASLVIKQSNHEGQIVDLIGRAKKNKFQGILINPAAYTHTSVAVRDAVAACGLSVVEVHLSNIYSREEFRHKSLISPVASGTILGFGAKSYTLGLAALLDLISTK